MYIYKCVQDVQFCFYDLILKCVALPQHGNKDRANYMYLVKYILGHIIKLIVCRYTWLTNF